MKKWVLLLAVMMLSACSSGIQPSIDRNDEPVQIAIKSFDERDDFTLLLYSEKVQYKLGEKVKVHAEITYTGEREEITIGHAELPIMLETTNLTQGYHFGAAMNEPYISTILKRNEPKIIDYHFSGGSYNESRTGKKYNNEEVIQMASMQFPVGQYQITGTTNFVIDGQDFSNAIKLKGNITFEVEK
ncbi:MAG: hypothetical protein RR588_07840 [Solibacillus sp.]